jgi:SAM-dependent methyltransferase
MKEFETQSWDQSYDRMENYIFFPKEEVVKFLSRFVRRKIGPSKFDDRIRLEENPKALDLGCGIGRQTILLQEFGFDGYGVDISVKAILKAKELAGAFNYKTDIDFLVLNEAVLPFADDFFDIAISDSVLDSMEFSFAKKYMEELERTVKSYIYLSLIASESSATNIAEDIKVDGEHEHGTIQSYYDRQRINELIENTNLEIVQLNKNISHDLLTNSSSVRYHLVLQKK